MSYVNLMLYSSSLPTYRKPEGGSPGKEEVINGDDPERQAEIDKLFDESDRH